MKVCILMGSPRLNGNTASLVEPFANELKKHDAEINIINLYTKTIHPCVACRKCQDVSGSFGCPQKDDMQFIFHSIIEADIFILATPIYSWYCTPPMKAVLDRLVYGMNKYYGNIEKKECLWENKKCAIISTCGYRVEKGADLFEQGIIRYCKHSNLNYIGMLAIRDEGYHTPFINDQKIEQTKLFAGHLADLFSAK
ncbi:flavodoxin family protein [Sinanaerobacter chloroacetimidivorans]|uniref:Flavodoxin family protein n=1 Tax=Sinanaerobacter chloroacetimidivorans TaxID=2818044 RepID=A0A8J8B0S7_9FIRM|nr:flavodoxin family protein [Sinanaerobacter chloroacetimidivorans]MBR0597474.1 flavodoxin family protein [Sinanaerobacter chloroacetimidivorans]